MKIKNNNRIYKAMYHDGSFLLLFIINDIIASIFILKSKTTYISYIFIR